MTLLNQSEQLRRQVYLLIRDRMMQGIWKPGSAINTREISKELGISLTPLRDALIRLETEGFVTILPQRGVIINSLTIEEAQHIYEVIGALESRLILSVFHKIGATEIAELKRFNEKMLQLTTFHTGFSSEFDDCNIEFHEVLMKLCENKIMLKQIRILKRRLYDFPEKGVLGYTWYYSLVEEHQHFVRLIEEKKVKEAADYIRDVHWVFRDESSYTKIAQSESAEKLRTVREINLEDCRISKKTVFTINL
jgi:DNA-binding GntR family transcriptional regulator